MLKLDKKKKVLFVGSFVNSAPDGSVGGQMFACRSLVESRLSENVHWILLDTTSPTNKHISNIKRTKGATIRIIHFLWHLVFNNIDIALIFTADGWSFLEKGLMSLLAKIFGVKVIIAPRSGMIINDIHKSLFKKKYINHVFLKVDNVLCQGESWKKYFTSVFDIKSDKFVCIPNWIDIDKYPKAVSKNSTPQILFMAWVDEQKGVFELLEAIKQISNDNLSFFLNIAGDGNAMAIVKNFVKTNQIDDKVKFHGWVNGCEKIALLQNSDIFILPSHFEGFPNSLLEAMACGIACVATNVGSVPDLITDKENGLLIPLRNVDAISKALSILINKPELRRELGFRARRSVETNNSLESAVQEISRIL